jgi:hypothetical protein
MYNRTELRNNSWHACSEESFLPLIGWVTPCFRTYKTLVVYLDGAQNRMTVLAVTSNNLLVLNPELLRFGQSSFGAANLRNFYVLHEGVRGVET